MNTRPFDLATLLELPHLPRQLTAVSEKLQAVVATSNPALHVPALQLISAPSKRIRSTLVIAAVAAKGTPIDQKVIASCAAVELVHLASLVHDDIIDGAETRWGEATVHRREGLPTAILVGDYLLARACQLAAEVSPKAVQLITAVIASLCEGESQELTELHKLDRSIDDVQAVMQKKTAALVATACQIGGVCAGATTAEVEALGRYGQHFGVAFQLIDDVLDFVADPALLDKPVGADVRTGNFTMPVLRALQGPQHKSVTAWLQHAESASLADLNNILLQGALQETISTAWQHVDLAQQFCEKYAPNSQVTAFAKLPELYCSWALNNLLNARYRTILSR